MEKQIAETEINGLKDEIARLHEQLQLARGHEVDTDLDDPTLAAIPSYGTHNTSQSSGNVRHSDNNSSQWSLSFGLWNYFFPVSEEHHGQLPKKILRV